MSLGLPPFDTGCKLQVGAFCLFFSLQSSLLGGFIGYFPLTSLEVIHAISAIVFFNVYPTNVNINIQI